MSDFGKVFLIGAGPGDPGLLTLRGKEVLERADVVVYDRLVSPAILSMCNAKAKMVDVGKMPTHHKVKQSEINKQLVQFAREIPHGVAFKQLPQVDRDKYPHRLALFRVSYPLVLNIVYALHHDRRKEHRQRRAVLF